MGGKYDRFELFCMPAVWQGLGSWLITFCLLLIPTTFIKLFIFKIFVQIVPNFTFEEKIKKKVKVKNKLIQGKIRKITGIIVSGIN